MISFEKYWLSRIISVQAVVTADYINGRRSDVYHHLHRDAWELIFSEQGSAKVRRGEEIVTLGKNDLMLIQPGVIHDLQVDDPAAKTFVMSFVCSNDAYLFPLQNTVLHAVPAMLSVANAIVRELTQTFAPGSDRLHLMHFVPDDDSPVGAEQMICCYLEQFLILLLRETNRVKGGIPSYGQFHRAFQTYLSDRVTDYVKANLSGRLTVQQVADHFHYSRARLSSLYKEATGVSIGEAINGFLIAEAKRRLSESGKSISEISEEMEFSSPQYFSYKFTKAVGVSPSRYAHGQE